MPEYLRKWNPIIYDWLKSYLYIHFRKWLPTSIAILLVLVVSALEHDFIISTGVGFFRPVYVLQYGIGGKKYSDFVCTHCQMIFTTPLYS